MNSAIEDAVNFIWDRYDQPLSLSDIATSAILSRFHFSRLFKDAVGVSPGRFLSAVRIYQAKRLLLNTSMNVTDISFAVGYNSLGSFTNHFTDSVGVSPGRFRGVSGNMSCEEAVSSLSRPAMTGTVNGTICLPDGFSWTRIYLGIFDGPIMQRRPLAAEILDFSSGSQPEPFRLPNVPSGSWYLHAAAVADTEEREPWAHRSLLVDTTELEVRPGADASVDVALHLRRPTDLPILLALPDLEDEDSLSLQAMNTETEERKLTLVAA